MPSNPTHFRQDISGFALRALSGRLDPGEIEAEATAQIRKLQSAGIAGLPHRYPQTHPHVSPGVASVVAGGTSLRRTRPFAIRLDGSRFRWIANRPKLWKRYGQVKLLNLLAGKFRRAVADAGMITTDGSVGVVATGALDDRLLHFILETLPEGTWEFVTHPGYNDADLDEHSPPGCASRAHWNWAF